MVNNKKFQKTSIYNYAERRAKIRELATEVGILNIDKKALAKEFKVSLKSIYNDFNTITSTSEFETPNMLKFIVGTAQQQALKKAQRILANSNDPKMQLRAAKVVSEISESITKFAESYGIKDKIAEKLQIEGEVEPKDFAKIYEKYHGKKSNKSNRRSNKKQRSKTSN